jgi:hypothetical protein
MTYLQQMRSFYAAALFDPLEVINVLLQNILPGLICRATTRLIIWKQKLLSSVLTNVLEPGMAFSIRQFVFLIESFVFAKMVRNRGWA